MTINYSVKQDREDVSRFIDSLKEVLNDKSFSLKKNVQFILNDKDKPVKYSNRYTLQDLEYSSEDVIERLKELKIEEYSETKIDRDDSDPLLLYVFGKVIKGKCVYIKLKVRNHDRKTVICISFHYAEWDMKFPFA